MEIARKFMEYLFTYICNIYNIYIWLRCYKSVTTQILAFLSYWYGKKRLQMHFQQV